MSTSRGRIISAEVNDKYGAKLVFRVKRDAGDVVFVRYRLDEKNGERNAAGLRALGAAGEYPDSVRNVADTVGRTVTVEESVFNGKTCYFLAEFSLQRPRGATRGTGAARGASPQAIEQLIAKLGGQAAVAAEGGNDDIPF
jgi:hypothetical protein